MFRQPAAGTLTTHAPVVAGQSASVRVGTRMQHPTFGVGQLLEVTPRGDDHAVTVQFKVAGKKKLMAKLARLELLS